MKKILVQIACRLDYELKNTVKDLLAKADLPNLIDIIIVNQDFEKNTWVQSQFPENVTLINMDETKTVNLSHARSFASLYVSPSHGYFFGIDAHSRFDVSWDTIVKRQCDRYGKKCVISAYPKSYVNNIPKERQKFNIENNIDYDLDDTYRDYDELVVNEIIKHPNLNSFHIQAIGAKDQTLEYATSAIAGGYHFTTIDWLYTVGYDPYMSWSDHELDLTIRSYTHGYDIVGARKRPIYHLYDHSQRKSTKSPISENNHNNSLKLKILSPEANFLGKYKSLGTERSYEDFVKEYNINVLKYM